MSAHVYYHALRKGLLVLIVAALLSGIAVWMVRPTPPNAYQATALLLVREPRQESNTDLRAGSLAASDAAQSIAKLALNVEIAHRVLSKLAIDMSTEQLTTNTVATSPAGSALIQVQVADSDPARAGRLAGELARQIAVRVNEMNTASHDDNAPSVDGRESEGADAKAAHTEVISVDPVVTSQRPSPPLISALIAGVSAGLAVAVVLLLAIAAVNVSRRSKNSG